MRRPQVIRGVGTIGWEKGKATGERDTDPLRTLGRRGWELGEATDEVDERGRRLLGEAILLLTNGGARSRPRR